MSKTKDDSATLLVIKSKIYLSSKINNILVINPFSMIITIILYYLSINIRSLYILILCMINKKEIYFSLALNINIIVYNKSYL